MNNFLKVFLFTGILIYGFFFVFSFQKAEKIERDASFFIKHQLEKELKTKIESFKSNHTILSKYAKKIIDKNNLKIKTFEILNSKIPSIILKMQDTSCECREKYKTILTGVVENKINILKDGKEKLTDFLKYKYMEIVQKLILDIRVFLGINLSIFTLLLIFLFIKPKANLQIIFVCSLLVISCLASSYFYIFEQNWFFTILYNDYVGYFYILYVAILFSFLVDIFLNKARITTNILNAILNALGSSVSAISC